VSQRTTCKIITSGRRDGDGAMSWEHFGLEERSRIELQM